ncbi:MAG TPA: hypothetical protein VK474_06905 [Chthoniobacterales bacterium]|nr:hypothetical protein [Chthoniobacterales bacterium]
MPKTRTNRLYSKMSDPNLYKFGTKTVEMLTGNLNLANPPVTPADLTLKLDTFQAAMTKAVDGGKILTAAKDAVRVDVTIALDKNASYVDMDCNNDLTILLSSGYQPVSSNRARTVLEAPEVVASKYGQTGEIQLRVKGNRNRRAIQGRVKPLGGEFGPIITFPTAREILFKGLAAGTTYVMQLCGLGGSTGQSDWSAPVTKVAV